MEITKKRLMIIRDALETMRCLMAYGPQAVQHLERRMRDVNAATGYNYDDVRELQHDLESRIRSIAELEELEGL